MAHAVPAFLLLVALAPPPAPSPALPAAPPQDARLPPVDVPAPEAAPALPDARDPTAFNSEVRTEDYAGEARSTAELMAAAPGATIRRLGDLGQLATVALRGSSADQVLIFLDGIPITSAASGTVDLSTIPPGLIDRIEILRGNAGARYGAGALGGVVNLVSRRPETTEAEGQLLFGSWNTATATVSGAVASPTAGVSASLDAFHSDGDFRYRFNPTPQIPDAPLQTGTRSNNLSNSLSGLARGFTRVGDGELTVVGQGTLLNRGLAGPIYAPTPTDHEEARRLLLGAKLDLPGTVHLDVAAQGRAEGLDVQLSDLGAYAQEDLEGGGSAGLSIAAGTFQVLRGEVGASNERLQGTGYGTQSRTSVDASIDDELSFFRDRLLVVPALRFDRQGGFEGLSPTLGISARPVDPLELRANVGESFRAPSFAELYLQQGLTSPNPDLTSEQGASVDLGAIVTVGRFSGSLTAFYSAYQNLILYELYPPFRSKPFNTGSSVIEGLEAQVLTRPISWLVVSASFTALQSWDNDPSSRTYGDPLPYRPADHLHARAAVAEGIFIGSLEADLASSQPLNRAGTVDLPGHFILDASAGIRLFRHPELWLVAEAKNLTNDQAPDIYGYPLPGLSFFISLRGRAAQDNPSHS
jgi:iron complex outermembrane receptor protein